MYQLFSGRMLRGANNRTVQSRFGGSGIRVMVETPGSSSDKGDSLMV